METDLELTPCCKKNKEPDVNNTEICSSLNEEQNECETKELGKYQNFHNDERSRKDIVEELKNNSSCIDKEGSPARYRLETNKGFVDGNEQLRKWTFGKRDESKKNRTIMLVGETERGKTTLINSLINYLIGVRKEDNVWFEISEVNEVNGVTSKTECITVYEVFIEASDISLSIIDTPGYGNIGGLKNDKNISTWLLNLLSSLNKTTPHPLDAVGLVVPATLNRLDDRQLYIFDAIQSLFGNDVKENTVVFVTHAKEVTHQNCLTAIEKANVAVAKINNVAVHFIYDNIQSDRLCASEEVYNAKWEMGQRSTEKLLKFIDTLEPQSLKKTEAVLAHRQDLEKHVQRLKECVAFIQTEQIALQKAEELMRCNEDFTYDAEKDVRERVPISYRCCRDKVTSCSVCKVNCHEGCWGICHPSLCRVMKNKRCTVCECDANKHVTAHSKYVSKKLIEQLALEKAGEIKRPNEEVHAETDEQLVHAENSFLCCGTYKVTRCTVCKVNCHEKCWGISDPRHCCVMKKKKCTLCNCGADKHDMSHFKFDITIEPVQLINEEKHRIYVEQEKIIKDKKAKLTERNIEKLDLIDKAWKRITELEKNALKCNSFHTRLHLDILIKRMEEAGRAEEVKILKELMKTNDLDEKAYNYMSSENNI